MSGSHRSSSSEMKKILDEQKKLRDEKKELDQKINEDNFAKIKRKASNNIPLKREDRREIRAQLQIKLNRIKKELLEANDREYVQEILREARGYHTLAEQIVAYKGTRTQDYINDQQYLIDHIIGHLKEEIVKIESKSESMHAQTKDDDTDAAKHASDSLSKTLNVIKDFLLPDIEKTMLLLKKYDKDDKAKITAIKAEIKTELDNKENDAVRSCGIISKLILAIDTTIAKTGHPEPILMLHFEKLVNELRFLRDEADLATRTLLEKEFDRAQKTYEKGNHKSASDEFGILEEKAKRANDSLNPSREPLIRQDIMRRRHTRGREYERSYFPGGLEKINSLHNWLEEKANTALTRREKIKEDRLRVSPVSAPNIPPPRPPAARDREGTLSEPINRGPRAGHRVKKVVTFASLEGKEEKKILASPTSSVAAEGKGEGKEEKKEVKLTSTPAAPSSTSSSSSSSSQTPVTPKFRP